MKNCFVCGKKPFVVSEQNPNITLCEKCTKDILVAVEDNKYIWHLKMKDKKKETFIIIKEEEETI